MPAAASTIRSVRPDLTAELMARTGLDEAVLTALVHGFYARIRADAVLGPIFDTRIADWPAHLGLPVDWPHFARWLALFEETAHQTCPPAGAALVCDRAQRIARNLHAAIRRSG